MLVLVLSGIGNRESEMEYEYENESGWKGTSRRHYGSFHNLALVLTTGRAETPVVPV